MTIDEEHTEARRLLPLLFEANRNHRFMTYVDAVEALGWDLRGSTTCSMRRRCLPTSRLSPSTRSVQTGAPR
jgi:hypothetical protein